MTMSQLQIQEDTASHEAFTKDRAQRLDYIDGLRALAVLSVFLYHSWLFSGCPWVKPWNILSGGFIGVNLFLVLSGFCLYWPMVKGNHRTEPSLSDFARRRLRRIYPPYIVVLIVCVVFAFLFQMFFQKKWPDGPYDLNTIAKSAMWHLAMLDQLRPSYIWGLNGPLWSLGLEVDLYVAMPILVVLSRKFGIGLAVSIAAIVTLVYRVWLNWYIGGSSGWEFAGHDSAYVLCYFLPGRWLEFAFGMLAASLIASDRKQPVRRLPFGWLCIICLTLQYVLRWRFGLFNPVSDAIAGGGFFCLIMYASCIQPGKRDWNLFQVFVRHPKIVGLGAISYSFYLIHQPILCLAINSSRPFARHNSLLFVISVFLFFPIIFLLSKLFYHICERHFINSTRSTKRISATADN